MVFSFESLESLWSFSEVAVFEIVKSSLDLLEECTSAMMSSSKPPPPEKQETKLLNPDSPMEQTWEEPVQRSPRSPRPPLLPTLLNQPKPPVQPPPQLQEALRERQRKDTATNVLSASREMLWLEEAERAHQFGRVIAILCATVMVAGPLLPLSPLSFSLLMGSIFMLGVAGAWVWYQTQNRRMYGSSTFRVFGVVAVLASMVIEYAIGVFSPAPVGIALGIAFFSLGDDKAWSIGICLSATMGYLVLAWLVSSGVIVDPSVSGHHPIPQRAQLFFIVMVPLCYVLVLGQARLSRRATHQAMTRLEQALLSAERDRAQRQELEQELSQVQRLQRRELGPFSDKVVGPYVLSNLLGRGAVGEVYAAQHSHTQQPIALKLLRQDVVDREHLKERFLQEGEMAVQLRSPHVIRVFEVGFSNENVPYIAMERLEGHALNQHIKQHHVLSLQDAVTFVAQITEGLEAVHQAGIIHRDINPQNLFLYTSQKSPCWKLLDFSISKWIGAPSGQYTMHGLLGTPGYMSPEQAWNQPLQPTSDIFGLGAVLYRALTGRPPFVSKSISEVLVNIILRQPSRPGDFVPLPRDVEYVLAIALAKLPEHRFQSSFAFGQAFALAAHQKLPASFREHAQKLLLQHPWGYEQEPPAWLFEKGAS